MTGIEGTLSRLAERLETLEAEAAIRRLMAAHMWLRDSGSAASQVPEWSECTTSYPSQDGTGGLGAEGEPARYWVTDGGVWTGSGLSESFDGFAVAAMADDGAGSFPDWMPRMMHFLTNEQIYVDSPTAARGRWYSWEAATVLVDGGHKSVWIAGRYECEFAKEGGEWRMGSVHFQEVFSVPLGSAGWVGNAHVAYGPRQSPASRHESVVADGSDTTEGAIEND